MKGKDFSMEKTTRLKRELAYTGTILKIYRDTVVANGIEEVSTTMARQPFYR